MNISIRDDITPALQARIDALTDRRGLHSAIGQTVAVLLRDHFRDKNTSGTNKKNWPRQNFWNRFKNVTDQPTSEAATLVIPDPQRALRHKIEGGTLRPKTAKYLAIPLAPEAYALGSRARYRDAFPDAFVVTSKRGQPILARPGQTKGSISPIALLLKSVTHRADPTALPPDTKLRTAAITGVKNFLDLLDRRAR